MRLTDQIFSGVPVLSEIGPAERLLLFALFLFLVVRHKTDLLETDNEYQQAIEILIWSHKKSLFVAYPLVPVAFAVLFFIKLLVRSCNIKYNHQLLDSGGKYQFHVDSKC